MNDLINFDNEIRAKHGIICGVDEAGRGPLAGNVYAAAVILPQGAEIEGLNDSKKLSEKKREELYGKIIETADAYAITSADVLEIEKINILNAAMLAMKRAIEELCRIKKPNLILIDGNMKPDIYINCKTVIKGDGLSACIAAASVLAKVVRDREMCKFAHIYPQYGFEKHKGYGTKLHCEKLREHGVSPIHRISFLNKIL